MKMRPTLLLPLLALAACNSQPSQPEVIETNPDPMKNQLANAAPVELPPAIRADKTLRCANGSLVGVTFFQGDKLASVRVPSTATPVRLTAPEAGKPYVGENGTTMTGDEKSVTVTVAGKPALTCHD
ncbi:hypothetical protein Q5H91_00180 [Sphingomonas sp. KR1UV-12]|uniref:C-type lysozyme inhibitor domain-containing protein n=1 Tax=Sphingomonas aurea TaxID=3063994 RepID=A0ABT9EF80_9SPHN|nr:hypothetical protein [Sphingomonas sp. KR1UV-12]MDP1025617.1 hypothetical protein [Sphingomonas sp. KR1UV-12]